MSPKQIKRKPLNRHEAPGIHTVAEGRKAAGRRPRTVIDDLTISCYTGTIRVLNERRKKQEQLDRLRALSSPPELGPSNA